MVGAVAIWQYLGVPKGEEKILEVKPSEKLSLEDEIVDWKTYRNVEFGFEFKYPPSWIAYEKPELPGVPTQEPYLFDMVIMTKGHPVHKAGHVFILDMSFAEAIDQLEDSFAELNQTPNIEEFSSVNLKGIKHQMTYDISYTDYGYILEFDGNILVILFTSIDTPERLISPELVEEIDKFARTFSKI